MPRGFQADRDGINEIARSPEMRAAELAVAMKAKGIAEGLAADFTDTGDYARHFKIKQEIIEWKGQYPGRRAATYLVNDSDHAAAVEWGNSRNHKPHHVLGRTLGMLK